MDKVLYLYTIGFPYEKSEEFLHTELPFLSKRFSKVVVFPGKVNAAVEIALPPNVSVCILNSQQSRNKLVLLVSNLFLIVKTIFKEFGACRKKMFFVKRLRLTLSEIIYALSCADKIAKLVKATPQPVVHYSFWMNEHVLALSFLKQKQLIKGYVFRVHGFDLYEERRENNYLPFRKVCYDNSSVIFPVSKKGAEYIVNKFGFKGKIETAYLGTGDYGTNRSASQPFTIVTCSRIVPLKRLTLLASALLDYKEEIIWYHIGDGEENETKRLKAIVANMPVNVKVNLKGYLSQAELFEFYKKVSVSALINVSETEGLPVSIMEAISFGIPAIATDVGGTSEIVTPASGVLIPADVSQRALMLSIVNFSHSKMCSPDFREGVRQFWQKNFSAGTNYERFCDRLAAL